MDRRCDRRQSTAAAAAQFKSGNEKALNAIKGAVMKASKASKANPQLVDEIVRKQLGAS